MALKVLYAMMVLGCSGEDDVNGKSRAVPSLMVSKDKTFPGVSSLAGVGPGSLGEIGKFKMLQKEDRACPSGYADITTQEACVAAASHFTERSVVVKNWWDMPPYCFKWEGLVYFNEDKDAFDPDQDAQKICQAIMCSTFTCDSGWVPKPNATALPGEDRATCCQEACVKELFVQCRFVDVCGARGLATCDEKNHRCKCDAGYCANSVGLLCSKNLDYASEIITGPGTGSGPMTALALLCVGMTMTMLISYIVVRRRASELSEGLLAAPVGGEEESAAPYTQASP